MKQARKTCLYCGTEHPVECTVCTNCGAPLPTEKILKSRRRNAVVRALLTAVLVPMFYYTVMYSVTTVWVARFLATLPEGITRGEFTAMYTDSFNRDSSYLNIISACVCILAAAVVFSIRRKPLAEAVNIRPASHVKTVSAFICGLTLQIPIGILLLFVPFSEAATENHTQLMNAATAPMWVQLLYGVIIAPVIEEMFFRGIAHDRLSKAMPLPLAAIISSAGFAIIHGELISITVAFACGIILALLYSKFNTIVIPAAFHMGFNLLSFAVAGVNDPLLLLAAATASVALFIVSTYLLFRRDTE